MNKISHYLYHFVMFVDVVQKLYASKFPNNESAAAFVKNKLRQKCNNINKNAKRDPLKRRLDAKEARAKKIKEE